MKKKIQKRQLGDSEDIKLAVNDVENGKWDYLKASRMYNVPQMTLGR